MEVAHRTDHVTHAVIGGGEAIHMGITDDAMFMQMLSSTLYSDKPLAVVRETACNSWDAHIESGRTGTPIHIILNNEVLVFKDFGHGIPHSKMGEVYGTYGKSTKKHDGNQTGGFGLGCKSPYAYTDHFEVISCHDGIKTTYKLTKSSAELNGKPGIVPILQVPTTETGLTVTIQLKQPSDRARFDTLIQRLVANGEINALYGSSADDLKPLKVIEFSQMQHGYAITKEAMLENYSSVCIRYGNVIYPLERHAEYGNHYDRVLDVLATLSAGNNYRHGNSYAIVLQAKGSSISITPSRESISMEEKTIAAVGKMLKQFLAQHHAGFNRECLELAFKSTDSYIKAGKAGLLLRSPNASNLSANTLRNGELTFITDTAKAARGYLNHTYPASTSFNLKDLQYRLTGMIKAGTYDKGLLQTFRRCVNRTSNMEKLWASTSHLPMNWLLRHIIAPITTAMTPASGVQKKRLFVYDTSGSGGWGYGHDNWTPAQYVKRTTSMTDLLPFLRNLVVLTHSAKSVQHRLDNKEDHGTFKRKHGTDAGYLIYVVPRSPKAIAAAREFFATTRANILDLTAVADYRDAPVKREAKDKVVKLVGFPTVASSRVGANFSQEEAKLGKGLTQRVEKPVFFTLLNAQSDRHNSTRELPDIGREASEAVLELWGDKGAVVFTSVACDKLSAAGVPHLPDFLKAEMIKLMQDKEVIKYLGVSCDRLSKQLDTDSQAVINAVNLINEFPVLYEALKLGLSLPPAKMQLLSLWEDMQYVHAMSSVQRTVRGLPLHKKMVALAEKLKASTTLPMLDFDEIAVRLKSKDPAVVTQTITFFLEALKG